MECREDALNTAEELIRAALESYMLSNCRRTVSMAKLTGQRRIRLEFHGLFRHYTPSEEFPRFMNALNYVVKCSGIERLKKILRARDVVLEGDMYVVYDFAEYEKMCRELYEETSTG